MNFLVICPSYLQAAALVDGAVDGDPGDEDSVVSVDAVALADVESQGLAGPLHDLHKRRQGVRVLHEVRYNGKDS